MRNRFSSQLKSGSVELAKILLQIRFQFSSIFV